MDVMHDADEHEEHLMKMDLIKARTAIVRPATPSIETPRRVIPGRPAARPAPVVAPPAVVEPAAVVGPPPASYVGTLDVRDGVYLPTHDGTFVFEPPHGTTHGPRRRAVVGAGTLYEGVYLPRPSGATFVGPRRPNPLGHREATLRDVAKSS